jgi:hypothetical protein
VHHSVDRALEAERMGDVVLDDGEMGRALKPPKVIGIAGDVVV